MPTLKNIIASPALDDGDVPMAVHPFTLAFVGPRADLEVAFLSDLQRRALSQQRFAAILTTFFYACFALLDAVVAPDLKHHLWGVRFAVVCPVFLLIYLLSYWRRFLPYFHFAVLAGALAGGLGIIYMTVIGNALIARTYYAGLMLVLMFLYGFLWLRFIWAGLCGWTLIIAYALAVGVPGDLPAEVLVNNAFFGISANLIGMAICYAIEYYRRRDFFMRQLLNEQREAVESAKNVLEERVGERTAMLARTNEDLRREIEAHQRLSWEKQILEGQLRHAQKMEAIGTLAGGIAHDFNNILAAILGHTELALMQMEDRKEAELCLSEVINASLRAKDLVGQILAFSRQSESELRPLQISIVVKEAMRLIKATLPTSITIKQQIEAVDSIVVADATQIHQIVINLCTNAAHAMESVGGQLEVCLEEEEIQLHPIEDVDVTSSTNQLEPGRYVCLSISDTGNGIPEHLKERIFDPYFTTKAKGMGTGLGLAVVRGIVQNHGGLIHVASKTGKGTRFSVYLPVSEGHPIPEAQPFHLLSQGNERVLLVDDEEGLAELGGKLLAALGYRVSSFVSAQDALNAFSARPDNFDVIITDMIMPHMSGEALSKEILALRPDVPIIAYTGFTNLVAAEQVKKIGVKAVLQKPITIHGMSQAIRKVLRTPVS